MTDANARRLVATLAAAFPAPAMSDATFALYVAELGRLRDEQAAQDAVTGLVRSPSQRFLPTIGQLLEAYRDRVRARTEWRETRDREHAAEVARRRGLPVGETTREPIPNETLRWLRRRGVNVDGLLRDMPNGNAA